MTNPLPTPPSEMSQMEWFLGKWEVTSSHRNEDGEWIEEVINADHTTVLGGNVIFEHFGGPLFGQGFEAWSLRKYNPTTSKWEQRWVDVTPGGFADWTGAWNQEKAQFVGNPNRTLDENGEILEEAAREVFFDIDENSFSWKYERTTDRGASWEAVWTLEYKRIG
jgi:hypothetical protein